MALEQVKPAVHKTEGKQPHETKGSSMNRVVMACMVGNALEWYDFAIYGFFAEMIGRQFFPASSPSAQILMSLMIFAAGFLARPIGAIIFGRIGDKKSRKDALLYSIYLMAIPTFLIGCWPPYSWIGLAAPIGLVVLRILQGLAIGGEFTGSIVFLVEHAEPEKRGLAGSWASFSLIAGVLIGSAVATIFTYIIPANSLETWGWRLPFLLSIVGSWVGTYIRRNLVDPSVYLEQKSKLKRMNIRSLIKQEIKGIGLVMWLDFLTAIGFFMIAIFLPLFFKNFLNLPPDSVQLVHSLNMLLFGISAVLGGILSDKVRPTNSIMASSLALTLMAFPLFNWVVNEPTLLNAAIAEGILCIFMGWFFGTLPHLLCCIFPTATRFSGVSIGHNLSMAIFGGTAPYAATYIIQATNGDLTSPAWLLAGAALLTFLSARWVPYKLSN